MNFKSGKDLLKLCKEHECPISSIMCSRESEEGGMAVEEIEERLNRVVEIMDNAVHEPIEKPVKSMGGLIGGEGRKIKDRFQMGNSVCGSFLTKAIAYSMAVLEQNASMGLIVAAPTAGSSGVIPGLMFAAYEEGLISKEQIVPGLLNAGAIGYLLTRNASVSGAEAGCQAEVGSASAMAASALTELMGGNPDQCLAAAGLALSNLLGLVCDPIAGLVEAPCQSRNAIGVANAMICSEMALSGMGSLIPFDEMAEAMYRVGKSIPYALRETALGGCAATPTGSAFRKGKVSHDMESLSRR